MAARAEMCPTVAGACRGLAATLFSSGAGIAAAGTSMTWLSATLNVATAPETWRICSPRRAADSAALSTRAMFWRVTSSICATARLISSMPDDCSPDALAISSMMSVTRVTEATISCMVSPARATWPEPADTLLTESSMRPLISLAAWALR